MPKFKFPNSILTLKTQGRDARVCDMLLSMFWWSAIKILTTGEEADIPTAKITKTEQLSPEITRWTTTGNIYLYIDVGGVPLRLVSLRRIVSLILTHLHCLVNIGGGKVRFG